MRRKLTPFIAAGMGILLLILDSRTAIHGAQIGIELCIYTVIPSLFPFIVLTGILTPAICGTKSRILSPIGKLCGMPPGSEGIFLSGILGGYPTGAVSIHQAWKSGQLRSADARRMLAFCSNAGPAFIFGILGNKFSNAAILWLLWGIHIISAVLVAILIPNKTEQHGTIVSPPVPTLAQSVKNAVLSMGYICGWIVLFRVILAFCERWFLWLLPTSLQVILSGLLELANGCIELDAVSSMGTRFVLCSAMLAFGGACIVMQTASVTGKLGLGLYLPGKLLQMVISILLSYLAQLISFPAAERAEIHPLLITLLLVLAVSIGLLLRKKKIRGSIPQLFGV